MGRFFSLRSSIRKKILALMLALALVPLLLVGWLSLTRLERARNTVVSDGTNALRAQAERTLVQQAADRARLYDRLLIAIQQQVESVAHYAEYLVTTDDAIVPSTDQVNVWIAPAGADARSLRRYARSVGQARALAPLLSATVQSNPLMNIGYMALEEGGVIVFDDEQVIANLHEIAPFDPRLRPWYRGARDHGSTFWTDLYVDANTQMLTVTCATPVHAADGTIIGVVGFDILLDTIKQDLLTIDTGTDGYALLMHYNGEVLAHPALEVGDVRWNESFITENWLIASDAALRSVAQQMLARNQGIAQITYNNNRVYVAFAPIMSMEWNVALIVPAVHIEQPALNTGQQLARGQEQFETQLLVLLLLTAVLICVVGALMSLSITRPIRALRNSAVLVASGDLDHQLPSAGEDEIGQLVASFNTMTSALRQKMAELEGHAHQLATLNVVSNQLKTILDLPRLLEAIPHVVCEHFGLERAVLYLVEGERLRAVAAAFGPGDEAQARHFMQVANAPPLHLDSPTIEADIVRSGQAVIVNDPWLNPRVVPAKQAVSSSQSYVQVPIFGREEQVIGILSADNHYTARTVNAQDANHLLMFASMVGLTIENVRLYDDLERQVAQRTHELRTALEQAQQADQRKSHFLTSISHELRTPLNAIIGFSTVLLDEIDGPLLEIQREDVQSIYRNGRFLLHLINELLDLARIEAGRLELACAPLDLRPLISEVLETAQGLRHNQTVMLYSQIAADVPPVAADANHVRQILLNLLSNALKFTEQGSVMVSACCMTVPGTDSIATTADDAPGGGVQLEADSIGNRHATQVAISVSDTGIGIPLALQGQIFQEFSQVHGGRSRAHGTGLGLSIVRHLVEAHGGHIQVESTPDVGSTFTFTLPIASRSVDALNSDVLLS